MFSELVTELVTARVTITVGRVLLLGHFCIFVQSNSNP